MSPVSPDLVAQPAFHICNLGCKVNRVESDVFLSRLAALGGRPVSQDEAQVVVVNTCTVTGEADKKARKAIHRALREPLAPWVVVTGCGAAIHPDELAALGERVVLEPDRCRVPALAAELLGLDSQRAADVPAQVRAGEGYPTRMGVKVQDGCDNACTYCIVHVARGKAKSRPADQVVAEVAAAGAAGVREVVLTGINLGRYDDEGLSLAGLLGQVLARTAISRVRLSSVEPPEVTDELLDAMAAGGQRVARHLHVPLQSGCQRTLAEMGRKGTAEEYARMVERARRTVPGIALTTDVIAGFPGETEEDFAECLSFCERQRFSKMHVFRYSRREGTPAAARTDQVPAPVAADRADRLRRLSDRMRAKDAQGRVGSVELVVFEQVGEGTSGSYHRVVCASDAASSGALIPVRFTEATPDGALRGEAQ